jgi:hypothetical protein
MFISPLSIKQHGIEAAIAHEYGHSVQSVYFGCLYLIVIGLPSALNPFDGIRYYESYPEKWASDIGGVECVQYGPGSCNYKLKFKS